MLDPSFREDEDFNLSFQFLIWVMFLIASSIPSKQLFLATISYPIVGGDSVCCGHRVAYLDPAAVHITIEDEENQETQQIYGPTA